MDYSFHLITDFDIEWNNQEKIIDAFQDRINGFYFKPASVLNKNKQAFAAGVICITIIDLLTKFDHDYNRVRKRYTQGWLIKFLILTNLIQIMTITI